MRIHILQHVPFEGPANILHWAQMKGHSADYTRFYEDGWLLPVPDSMDFLVVLGGPMGVHDEVAYPWLNAEKEFMRKCIQAQKQVLGICLGAQLAANVLGANVYPNPHKEIGWFALHKTNIPHPVLFDMAPEQMVFHWHGDTFDLPPGALHLATSDACVNQAFIWKEQVLGLQFHMEMSGKDIELLMENSYQELIAGEPYVQSDPIIRDGFEHADMLSALFDSILTRFTS